MVEMDGFGIAVAVFILITLAVGVFAGRLVKKVMHKTMLLV